MKVFKFSSIYKCYLTEGLQRYNLQGDVN